MTRQTPVRYPSQMRARVKYERMIAHAAELVDELGLAKVSPVDVCKATGYSIGSFYSYFTDIHHVIDVIQTRHVDRFAQAYEAHLGVVGDQTGPSATWPDLLALILPAMEEVSRQAGWPRLQFRSMQAAWLIDPLIVGACPAAYDVARELLLQVATATTAAVVRLTVAYPDLRQDMFELQERTLRGLAS